MKRFAQRFAAVLVVLSWAHVSAAQTADEVIEKSITAFGGRPGFERAVHELQAALYQDTA